MKLSGVLKDRASVFPSQTRPLILPLLGICVERHRCRWKFSAYSEGKLEPFDSLNF